MKSNKHIKLLIVSCGCLAVLILDSQTAINGARAGLEICLHTVLPSLFPFVFLSSMLVEALMSSNIKWLRDFSRIFRIPQGAEGILITGVLGGFPVGARCVDEAVREKRLENEDARRMLIICNAAGPAFIFGIGANIFQERWIPWLLWLIQLFSAFCMSKLLPPGNNRSIVNRECINQSIPERLRQSLKAMGEISAWIILMRVVFAILQKWLLWRFSKPFQVLLTGVLELSNGCISLKEIEKTGVRFILCSCFLAFGGLCVALQTSTAAASVDQRLYLPGKCVQALICFVVAYILQLLLFSSDQQMHLPWFFFLAVIMLTVIYTYSAIRKNSCGNLAFVDV
jgi:hypothetical protein